MSAELKGDLKALAERMSTHQATYETALERFGRQTDAGFARLKQDMDRRDAEAAKRETRLLGYTVGAVGVGVALLGAFIALVTLNEPAPIVIQTVLPMAQVPAEGHAAPEELSNEIAAEPSAPAAEKQPDG